VRGARKSGQADERRRANRDRPGVARVPQRRDIRRDRPIDERVHEQHRAGEERNEREQRAEREQRRRLRHRDGRRQRDPADQANRHADRGRRGKTNRVRPRLSRRIAAHRREHAAPMARAEQVHDHAGVAEQRRQR